MIHFTSQTGYFATFFLCAQRAHIIATAAIAVWSRCATVGIEVIRTSDKTATHCLKEFYSALLGDIHRDSNVIVRQATTAECAIGPNCCNMNQ